MSYFTSPVSLYGSASSIYFQGRKRKNKGEIQKTNNNVEEPAPPPSSSSSSTPNAINSIKKKSPPPLSDSVELQKLLQQTINSLSQQLKPAMYRAVREGNIAKVVSCMNQGIDINALVPDSYGVEMMPLQTACYWGKRNIVELFVSLDKQQELGVKVPQTVNINWVDPELEATALHAIVGASGERFSKSDRLEIVKLLCEAGANVFAENWEGDRPSDIAEENAVREYLENMEKKLKNKEKSLSSESSSSSLLVNTAPLSKVLMKKILSLGKDQPTVENVIKIPLKLIQQYSQAQVKKVGRLFSSKSNEEIVRNPRFSITPEISGMIKNKYLNKFTKLSFRPTIGPKEPFKFRPLFIHSIGKIFGDPLLLCDPDMIKKIENNYLQKERTGLIFQPTNDTTPEATLKQFVDSLTSIRSEGEQLREIATFTDKLAATPSSLHIFIREFETKRREKNEAGNIWRLIDSRLENKHKTAYNAAKRERADMIDMAVLKQFINAQLPTQSSGGYKRKQIADIANLLNKRPGLFSESILDKAIEREKDADPNYANILRSIKSSLSVT